MKSEDELKFPFYTKPIAYFIGAIALLVAAGFIVYSGETSKQGPGFVRFMYQCAGGLGLAAILTIVQGLRLTFSTDRPHIVFTEQEVSMPVSWFGFVKTVRLDELVEASLEYNKEHRFIALKRNSGKPIKIAEAYFFSRQDFEECWSVFDAICQNQLSLSDARASFEVRSLCTICGTVVPKTESVDGKCSKCAALTVGDIRMIGVGATLVGFVFVLIGVISVVYTMLAGWGWIFAGVAAVGLGLMGTGLCIAITGKISTSSQSILRSAGFWRK